MSMDSALHQGHSEASGMMTRVGEQLRQLICGLHGHDSLMHFEKDRVSLLCSSCGYETPGWDVKGKPAGQETRTPERRVAQIPFIGERRVA
jgi:hypothetical protein